MERTFLHKSLYMLLVASLFLSILMASVSVQSSSTTQLRVDPSKIEYWTPAFGETFMVNVSIANVTELWGYEFKLYWNTTLLDLVKAETFPFLSPPLVLKSEINETLGRYWLNVTTLQHGVPTNGSGTLLTLSFQIAYEPFWPINVTSTLDLAETKLVNSYGDLIPHDVYDGEYWCYPFPFLSVTTMTDKPFYDPNETICVYGNLTLGFSPVQDGLVALEVDNPQNEIMVIRTLSTGVPPANQTVEIVNVIPCGGYPDYPPRNSFKRGETVYFNVTIRNNDSVSRRVLVTTNLYDSNSTTLGATSYNATFMGGTTSWCILQIIIPDTASLGEARVYASALTGNWPRDGGTAYCPEKNATFQIVNSTAGATAPTPITSLTESNGNYNLTFKLPINATAGIYRTHASASYQGRSTRSSMAFGVNVIRVPDHYPTIQGAVNAASPTNNSILVLPGTYNEHVTIDKPLTLVGRDPRITVINGGGAGTVVTVTAGNVTVSRFKIRNSGSSFSDSGIALNNSSGSTISENIMLENYYGINIHSCDNNSILDNTLSRNNYGIYLNRSTSNTLRGNNMMCNKYNFGVFGDSVSEFTHAIDTSNTVNIKPVIYWIDRHDDEVPSNAGFVAIVSSTNITVRGLDLTKNVQGVLFAYSYGNTIIGSRVSNNSVGIYLRNSNESNIYHNNFIDNVNQVERYQSSNTWDDGGLWLCPICGQPQPKGNYWSDYTGSDNGASTQAHNCAGDGVGDTFTPHLGVDKYPLMSPWILAHDVSITSVTYVTPNSLPFVIRGKKVTVNTTVKNKGDSIETFNVTAYANTTIIQTQTVTLPVRSTTTVTMTWDTTDVALGNYTISASATTLPGEIYTGDNTYTDGTVKVACITGDVDGNGIVNIGDIVIIALAFGSQLGDPNWNPIADIAQPWGIINIGDIVIVAIHFGETA